MSQYTFKIEAQSPESEATQVHDLGTDLSAVARLEPC
jgi:hypothetical protein